MKNLKKKTKHIVFLAIGLIVVILLSTMVFFFELRAFDKNIDVSLTIEKSSSTVEIIDLLKEKELIRNKLVSKIYIALNIDYLQAGDYILNPNMGTRRILEIISKGQTVDSKGIKVTFHEGKKITDFALVVNEKLGISEEDFLSVFKDTEFLNTLISNYEIVTEDILNNSLYYSLEGYLFPDTYYFAPSATAKDVVKKMVATMNNKILSLKNNINNSSLSIHDVLTMASIVELEAKTKDDRILVASVFYNRLNKGISLGSDVTTYYAAGINMGDRDLTAKELNACNKYNTRGSCVPTLPVGPISNPSLSSIEAVLTHKDSIYYYFVADNKGKVYFNENYDKHQKTIKELKNNNLWYNY